MQGSSSSEIFRFGTFDLDLATRRLQKGGMKIALEERPFRFLALLVSHAGETLTQEELRDALWPDNVHIDFGHALKNAANKARAALGDRAENPRFIATVRQVGYRFIAPVERVCPDLNVRDPVTPPPDLFAREIAVHPLRREVVRGLAYIATFVSLLAAAWLMKSATHRLPVTSPEPSPVLARRAGEAYAMGIDSRRFVDDAALRGSEEYFKQAVALDPTFAEAHAQLALTDVLIGDEASLAPRSDYGRALLESRRALDLDPLLAEAHVAFGDAKLRTDWDWENAKHEYLRALDLNPNSVGALDAYARFLGATGQRTESLRVIAEAQALDPSSIRIRYDKALLIYLARDYPRAIKELRTLVEVEPEFADARKSLSDAYARAGLWNQAASELMIWLRQIQVGQEEIRATQRILRTDGLRELWRRHARGEGCPRNSDMYGIPFNRAVYSALLGETEPAIVGLHGAYEQHDPRLLNLKVDPQFDKVRSDPQFVGLLDIIGLTTN
jgi:DNA-binding winged helix-turn-helix (wHTH) protein/tetratricopeptide (TPR) repeat protein